MGGEREMKNKKFQSDIIKLTEEVLNKLPKERFREIIERRFGFKKGKKETLEAIGQDHNITRERVRQIEASALKILREEGTLAILLPVFKYLDTLFEEQNHLIGEKKLLDLVSDDSSINSVQPAITMVLTLGERYKKNEECDDFHSHWSTQEQTKKQAREIVSHLENYLDNQKASLSSINEALAIVSAKYKNISDALAHNALDVSKKINKNIFGEVGLSHWPEISPKGVRDKAYLVLKKEGTPQHFVEVAELINKASFSNRQAFPQTVHNELIKDGRFVLIGRGKYALREWGYEPGIVKDVITKILGEANEALTKEEIIAAVLEKREIKPNTIAINLQNNSEFEKLEDGRYKLV